MTETAAAPAPTIAWQSKRIAREVARGTLIFNGLVIAYLIRFGESANSLHVSALSWAFTLSGSVILATLGGQAIEAWKAIKAQ